MSKTLISPEEVHNVSEMVTKHWSIDAFNNNLFEINSGELLKLIDCLCCARIDSEINHYFFLSAKQGLKLIIRGDNGL